MMIPTEQLLDIQAEYGSPVYVYDANQIVDNYKLFTSSFSVKDLKVHYACKALTNISILKLFKKLGAGLDCVSEQEVQLGLHAGFDPNDIIYTPNGVSIEEYERVLQHKTKVTVDNLSLLEKIGVNYPDHPIHIRINPHLMAGGNQKISVGHIDSKFGISIHQLPHILRLVKTLNINVEGIHVHTGSDIIDKDVFIRVAELIFSIADQFDNITSIDLGSGFKVQYKDGDMYTDIAKLGKAFSDRFNAYCQEKNREITLRFEPGKFMVSNAGFFLTKVNVVKQTTSCTFAGINTGLNHLIRPMFYDAYHGIENISNPTGEQKLYSVVGNICETDTFADNRLLNEVREGDTLIFKNAGAYCFTMASNYNSRLRPPEVMVLNGKAILIRERETIKDILSGQPEPTFTLTSEVKVG